MFIHTNLGAKLAASMTTRYLYSAGLQLRVTAARSGTVNFELDIQKEHTVCPFKMIAVYLRDFSEILANLSIVQNRLGILHGGTIASMGRLISCTYATPT